MRLRFPAVVRYTESRAHGKIISYTYPEERNEKTGVLHGIGISARHSAVRRGRCADGACGFRRFGHRRARISHLSACIRDTDVFYFRHGGVYAASLSADRAVPHPPAISLGISVFVCHGGVLRAFAGSFDRSRRVSALHDDPTAPFAVCRRYGAVLRGRVFMFHTYISPEVYELFVKSIAEKLGKPIPRVKIVYDCASCVVGVLLSFLFFGLWHFEGVKIGTVVCALLNGWLIGQSSRWFEQRFTFRDAFPWRPFFEGEQEKTAA